MSIKVLQPGLLTTVQDLGRHGYQKYGVIVSGAMDRDSLRIANLLVGNEEGEAGLEITLAGPSLLVTQDTLMAITGGDLSPTLNQRPFPMGRPVYVKEGSVLEFGVCRSGCRAYLAVAGGFDVPAVMGSKSTYLRAGIGGFQGRALRKGDELSFQPMAERSAQLMQRLRKNAGDQAFASTHWYAEGVRIPPGSDAVTVHVTKGSQFDWFDETSRQQFFSRPYRVTPQSDRMGYRLSGATLQLKEPREMISEGVGFGTIQVPPDGQPIILLADRQTTGGYPCLAQAAIVDLSVIAQMKPGDQLSFREMTLEQAEKRYLDKEKDLEELKIAIRLKMAQEIR